MSHVEVGLDLTASFSDVVSPTPFGYYDSNTTFQTEANGLVKLVDRKLGGSVLGVELTNKDVYLSFEEACLEYSSLVNNFSAKSTISNILGSVTGSLSGSEQKNPRSSLSLAKRRADAYGSEALVGGTRTLYSASIDLVAGQQNYDLKVLLSSSGVLTDGNRAEIRDVFHFSPTNSYRFFDSVSSINYLNNQFKFESFTPETVFYLLPIWEDVLRGQQLELSHRVRRSNYSYNLVNNVLKLYPVPTTTATVTKLHFNYYLTGVDDDPYDDSDPFVNGVSNLSNVPFGNIDYDKINSMGRQWIRRFAMESCKEILGQVRSKVQSVPIPNGDLVLNGPELVAQAREEMVRLREELKELLESMTYTKLAEQEAQEAEYLMNVLKGVPLGIFVGGFYYFLLLPPVQ